MFATIVYFSYEFRTYFELNRFHIFDWLDFIISFHFFRWIKILINQIVWVEEEKQKNLPGTWVSIIGIMYRLCCGEHVSAHIDNCIFLMQDWHRPKIPLAISKFVSNATTISLSQHTRSVSGDYPNDNSIKFVCLAGAYLFTIFIYVRASIE